MQKKKREIKKMHTNAKRGKMKTQKKTRRENEPNNEHAVKKQKAEIKKTHTNAKTGKMKTQKETGRENKPVSYPTYYDLWLLSCKRRRILNHGQIRLKNTKKIQSFVPTEPKNQKEK